MVFHEKIINTRYVLIKDEVMVLFFLMLMTYIIEFYYKKWFQKKKINKGEGNAFNYFSIPMK